MHKLSPPLPPPLPTIMFVLDTNVVLCGIGIRHWYCAATIATTMSCYKATKKKHALLKYELHVHSATGKRRYPQSAPLLCAMDPTRNKGGTPIEPVTHTYVQNSYGKTISSWRAPTCLGYYYFR